MHKPYGFEIIKDFPDWKVFKTNCECLHDDHECTIELDYDKECNMLTMTLSNKADLSNRYNWYKYIFIKRWWKKFKTCLCIMFDKELNFENSLIFRGREHVENFADFITLLGKNVEKESNELDRLRQEVKRLKNK